jgi:hypothetical protein
MVKHYRVVEVYLYRVNQNVSDLVILEDGDEYEVPIDAAIQLVNDGNVLYTEYDGNRTPLQIVSGPIRGTYLRTLPNGCLEDNLLHLARRR